MELDQQEPLADELRAELSRAVRSVCPPWLQDHREDIVQNAVIRVLELLRRSEGNRQLTPSYLWKVAYSAMIDEIRRLHPERQAAMTPAVLEGASFSGADPERESSGREVGEAIQGCLMQLVRPRRLAVTLYLYGHSVPEAARLLGWGVKRTENLVYRGLADMRGCLKTKGMEP